MKKRSYDFIFKFEVSVETYPNQKKRLHDKMARAIIRAFEEYLGIPCISVRDCETGRFRKL